MRKDCRSIIALMLSPKMRRLVPYMIWSGISLSVYTGLLIPMIVLTIPEDTEDQQMMKSLFSMVSLGIGEIVGALFIG